MLFTFVGSRNLGLQFVACLPVCFGRRKILTSVTPWMDPESLVGSGVEEEVTGPSGAQETSKEQFDG